MVAKVIQCPFMNVDYGNKTGELKITCEHGRVTFKDRDSMREYIGKYCGCEWQSCTLAQSLLEYYERND